MDYKVLIIDDHPIFRQGLIALLEHNSELTVCGEASDHMEAMSLLKANPPDVITLDLNLKSGSGLQLLKQIRAYSRLVKILVTSMHDEELFAERCIQAGANGYISKEEAAENIIDAINCVLTGGLYLSQTVINQVARRKLLGKDNSESSPELTLSNRELEVFMMVGKGLSTQAIAQTLHLSSKTIDTHKEHIKKKLGVKDNTGLIQRAVAWGIRESLI